MASFPAPQYLAFCCPFIHRGPPAAGKVSPRGKVAPGHDILTPPSFCPPLRFPQVESALVGHPACAEAAVVPVEHPIKGQAIYAFVTLVDGEA